MCKEESCGEEHTVGSATNCCSPIAEALGDSLSRHGRVPGRDFAGAWAVQALGYRPLQLDFEPEEVSLSTVQEIAGVFSRCLRAVGALGNLGS